MSEQGLPRPLEGAQQPGLSVREQRANASVLMDGWMDEEEEEGEMARMVPGSALPRRETLLCVQAGCLTV